MSLFRNLQLAGTIAWRHISDDPVVLGLQISRRLPAKIVQPIAALVASAVPGSFTAPSLIATVIRGDISGLELKFSRSMSAKLSANRARLCADIAIAAGMTPWADKFLKLASGSPRLASTVARRKWYDGDMTGAIDALEGARGVMAKQRERLEGERRTFKGWAPALSPVAMDPVPGRVMHLLTNSLPHTGSGYAQRSHSILTALQDAGWDVAAVTRLGYPVQVGKLFSKETDLVDGLTYRRLIPHKLGLTADARLQQEAESLLKLALEFRPEILHTTTHFTNGLVVGAVAEALGIPWVYEVRGQLADTWASARGPRSKTSERYQLFQDAEVAVMMRSDGLVTLGESMRAGILEKGIRDEKIILAPNGVGGAYLENPVSPRDARVKLGLDTELDYIGTVSSLVDYEGLDDLITAVSLLMPHSPNLRLLIVGDGVAAPKLKAQASKLGIAHIVVFVGRVPRETAAIYHQALDVFVVPRKNLELTQAVTPLKPVEALAMGRPVIASDLPALREIVIDGLNGRLIRPEDPVELASVLGEMLLDSPLRMKLGSAGRELVLENRTWSANAEKISQLYRNLEAESR